MSRILLLVFKALDVVTPSSIQDLFRLLSEILWQRHTDVPKVLSHNLSIQALKLWKTLLEDLRKAAEVYTLVKLPAHSMAKIQKQPFALTFTPKAISKFTSTRNACVWTGVGIDEDK